jgi:F0F1-type ATP synthase assembly protein I
MPENKTPPNKKKQPNRYLVLTSVATQIGGTIYLGAYFGKKLDARYAYEKPWFTIGLVLLALIVSMYSVIKQLNRLNEKD